VTSASERTFSVFGRIHSKERNRLYNHKVEKLVFTQQNMRKLKALETGKHVDRFYVPESDSDSDSDSNN
jgi:hypothetical protein